MVIYLSGLLQDFFIMNRLSRLQDFSRLSASLATSSFLSSWQELELQLSLSFRPCDTSCKRRTPERKMQRRIDRRLVSCSRLISPAGSSLHFLCSRQRTSRENHTAAVELIIDWSSGIHPSLGLICRLASPSRISRMN